MTDWDFYYNNVMNKMHMTAFLWRLPGIERALARELQVYQVDGYALESTTLTLHDYHLTLFI